MYIVIGQSLVLLNCAKWLVKEKHVSLSQPMKTKTKTNRDSKLTCKRFPALGAGGICLLLFCGLVHCTVYLYCDWPEYTLIGFGHGTKLKTTLF